MIHRARYLAAALAALLLVGTPSAAEWPDPQLDSIAIKDGANGNKAIVDSVSNSLVTISFAHHECHEGDCFVTDLVDTAMDATHYIGISFTTPAASAGHIHLIGEFASLTLAHLDFIEVPQTLTSGVAEVAYNRDRDSSTTTVVTSLTGYNSEVGTDAIVQGTGTLFHDFYTFSDKKSSGGGARDVSEFKLKPSTSYAFKLTSDANNNAAQLTLNWYQHKDSN